MRIGFDIDGVLTDIGEAWNAAYITATGRDLFLPSDAANPPVYDWPQYRGYTDEEVKAAMHVIATSKTFWAHLPPRPDVQLLAHWYGALVENHEIYFITQRFGILPKRQTEEWLQWYLDRFELESTPTVLIVGSGQKGYVARALGLDCFLDDHYSNARDVVRESPSTRMYLVNRSYNAPDVVSEPISTRNDALIDSRRVTDIGEYLRAENLIPYTTQVDM